MSDGSRSTSVFVSAALVLLAILAPEHAHAQCAGGRVSTFATQGRCCWPGQQWSNPVGRCVGPPQCPYGLFAQGDECVAGAAVAYTPGPPMPAATIRRPIWGLVIAGAVTLGVTWLATPTVGAAVEASGQSIGVLAIPVAGPWVCLAGGCEDPDDYVAALVVSGVLQAAGLTMLILGLVIQQEVQLRAELAPGVEWALRPWAAPSAQAAAGVELTLTSY